MLTRQPPKPPVPYGGPWTGQALNQLPSCNISISNSETIPLPKLLLQPFTPNPPLLQEIPPSDLPIVAICPLAEPLLDRLPPPSAFPGEAVISLGAFRGRGRLWHTYSTTLSHISCDSSSDSPLFTSPTVNHPPPPSPVSPILDGLPQVTQETRTTRAVLKIWRSNFQHPDREGHSSNYSRPDAHHAISKEWRAHAALARAEGPQVAPRHFGLWGGQVEVDGEVVEVVVALMEDAGIDVDVYDLTDQEKAHILSLYDTIHGTGIIHVDCRPKHWLKNQAGEIRIVDYEGSNFWDDTRGRPKGLLWEIRPKWGVSCYGESKTVSHWLKGVDLDF
ncbi:hypothetical protein IAT38_000312 [Cryptococcus sp. DSM 104549]